MTSVGQPPILGRTEIRANFSPPGAFVDHELMRILSDELRVRIYAYLCDHTAGPSEVADVLEVNKNSVRHHIDRLREGGWIGDDPSVPGRGGHYRAIRSMVIPPGAWDRIPEPAKHKVAVHMLRHLYADAGSSLAANRFLRPGVYMSLTPMVVDAQGQRDVKQILEEALRELAGVQVESDHRRAKAGQDAGTEIPLTVGMFGFESLRDSDGGARPSATMRL
jgi:DNA-binding transcriptional ArsR family regulator